MKRNASAGSGSGSGQDKDRDREGLIGGLFRPMPQEVEV
jgi:hypothetical protein